jgi:hypothetical protein
MMFGLIVLSTPLEGFKWLLMCEIRGDWPRPPVACFVIRGAWWGPEHLNGNDALANPLTYDCTGTAGMTFPYTTALSGYDTYQVHMWGDFALVALALIDTNPPVAPAPGWLAAGEVIRATRPAR